ncbi:Putative glutathione S-transferase [Gloeomargarita lithophora Alchichica-D10]|uniref:Glutathione S-transferase n=2 Tax=Gloeomargarita TaxID=1188227 RepID=A0A1J0ABT0_9CYAN|nr:glutathione S-transferase family protein [Gloeomargarita lithophora]APB33390.1 Putative glutathione S-transferase [Gloeomargarita lithophora Alchichica-D10]
MDGVWHDQWYETTSTGGRFVRQEAQFRHWITADVGQYIAESGRYHLYVSYACPWAHRTLIFRALKGLESLISISVVNWLMGEQGWTFTPAVGVIPDPIFQAHYLHEIYTQADPHYTGRVTVPVLWDQQTQTIVNNESSEIIRMFNQAFDQLGTTPGDYYPLSLRPEIDAINERIYHTVNNGVYRCGFATSQSAYDEAIQPLFATLDWLEVHLATHRYLLGAQLTEADWRLFTTLVRFDPVYVGHFKCNLRRLVDYSHLWAYVRELYQMPGMAATVNMEHIKGHYYQSHATINPTRIVPAGPLIDLMLPHGREGMGCI